MNQLSSATVRLITSSQVITSVTSAVKELVENSLDAKSSSVEVKVENYGLDKIEVRDNGCGVPRVDVEFMGQPHYTSKLSSTEDLQSLSTYGFRGEALGSLCAVSEVTVTTKTPSDDVSYVYSLNHKGHVTSTKPSHLGQGTTVCAVNLFKNLPVRKQFYSTVKKKKESLKQLEELVVSFAVICPSVRYVLKHGKETLWQTNPVPSSRHVLHRVLGAKVTGQLVHLQKSWDTPQFELEAYLPGVISEVSETSRSTTEQLFTYVNNRPVILKSLEKVLKEHYSKCHDLDTPKFPVGFVHIKTSSELLDVNLEPNKTKVMFHNQAELLKAFEEEIEKFYTKEAGITTSSKSNTKDASDHKLLIDNDTGLKQSCRNDSQKNIPCENSERTLEKPQVLDIPHTNSCHGTYGLNISPGYGETCKYDDLKNAKNSSENVRSEQKTVKGSTSVYCGVKRALDISEDDAEVSYEERLKKTRFDTEKNSLEENNGLEISKKGSLFSLDDSLDDLLLTNEKMRNYSHNITDKENIDIDVNVDVNEDNNNLTSFGSKDLSVELPQRSSQGHSFDCLNDSNFVTSTRAENDSVKGHCSTKTISRSTSVIGESGVNHLNPDSAFKLFDDSDEDMMMLDIDTPVKNQENGTKESVSSWSKGTAVMSADGSTVQPVQLLQPGIESTGASLIASMAKGRPCLEDMNTREKQVIGSSSNTPKQGVVDSPCQPTLFECSGVSTMKKPTTAYISFAKEVRPKVLEDHPSASFQDIARITGQRWSALTEDEKQKYKDDSKKELERFKEQQSKLSMPSPVPLKPLKRKKLQKKSSPVTQCLNKTKCGPAMKEQTVQFSMNALRRRLSNSQTSDCSHNESETTLFLGDVEVGDIRCWIGLRGNQIIAFQPIRATELLIYHKLMQNHALPVDPLVEPIILMKSDFTDTHHWQTLQSLQKSDPEPPDPYCHFTDVKLLKNGFRIRQLPGSVQDSSSIEIVGMTRTMNYFGRNDLFEILAKITACIKKSGHCTLRQCRPTKVDHFLQAEAVRMSRQLPVKNSQKEAEEILQSIKCHLPPTTEHCFHDKPFVWTLYDLEDIPLTQTQSQT